MSKKITVLFTLISFLIGWDAIGQQSIVLRDDQLKNVYKHDIDVTATGDLLIASNSGLYLYDGSELVNLATYFKIKLKREKISCVEQAPNGDIFIGYFDAGVEILKTNGQLLQISNNLNNYAEVSGFEVNDFYFYNSNTYVATSYGLFKIDKDHNYVGRYSFSDSYPDVQHGSRPSNLLRCIVADPGDSASIYMVGTMGLCKFDISKKKWKHLPIPKQLMKGLAPQYRYEDYNNFMVTDIKILNGHVYCASWGGGVMIYDIKANSWKQVSFQKYTTNMPMDENITSKIARYNDSLLLFTTFAHTGPVLFNIKSEQVASFNGNVGNNIDISLSIDCTQMKYGTIVGYHEAMVFYPNEAFYQIDEFKIRINSVQLDDSIVYRRVFNDSLITNISLNPQQEKVKLTFATKSIFLPDNYQFTAGSASSLNTQQSGNELIINNFKSDRNLIEIQLNNPSHKIVDSYPIVLSKKFSWYKKPYFYLISGIILFVLLGFIYLRYLINYAKKKDQKNELQQYISQLEINALQAQLNPHFLFNSLNTIKGLISQDKSRIAINYLNEFSVLMRKMLEYSKVKSITMSEELELMNIYIELEQTRFNSLIKSTINISNGINTNQILVPPFLLQPFVENSIIHGFAAMDKNGSINVEIFQENNNFIIKLKDNGCGLGESPDDVNITRSRHGIELSKERLSLCHKNSSISIYNNPYEQGTTIEIMIPLIHE